MYLYIYSKKLNQRTSLPVNCLQGIKNHEHVKTHRMEFGEDARHLIC